MQSGTTSVTGTQTDVDADADTDADADAFVDCGHLNKHFGNGHATPSDLYYHHPTTSEHITDRSMLLPPEHTANGFLPSGIVTYKAKTNGFNYDFNSTSSTSIGSVNGGGGCSGGGAGGGASSAISSPLPLL